MTKMEKHAILIHALFVIICMIMLLIPVPIGMGSKLFILVVIYNIILPIFGWKLKHKEWLNIWLFAIILSIFQV